MEKEDKTPENHDSNLEERLDSPSLTRKMCDVMDFGGIAIIYGSFISYAVYRAATKIPDVIDQASQLVTNISQYFPIINS